MSKSRSLLVPRRFKPGRRIQGILAGQRKLLLAAGDEDREAAGIAKLTGNLRTPPRRQPIATLAHTPFAEKPAIRSCFVLICRERRMASFGLSTARACLSRTRNVRRIDQRVRFPNLFPILAPASAGAFFATYCSNPTSTHPSPSREGILFLGKSASAVRGLGTRTQETANDGWRQSARKTENSAAVFRLTGGRGGRTRLGRVGSEQRFFLNSSGPIHSCSPRTVRNRPQQTRGEPWVGTWVAQSTALVLLRSAR